MANVPRLSCCRGTQHWMLPYDLSVQDTILLFVCGTLEDLCLCPVGRKTISRAVKVENEAGRTKSCHLANHQCQRRTFYYYYFLSLSLPGRGRNMRLMSRRSLMMEILSISKDKKWCNGALEMDWDGSYTRTRKMMHIVCAGVSRKLISVIFAFFEFQRFVKGLNGVVSSFAIRQCQRSS